MSLGSHGLSAEEANGEGEIFSNIAIKTSRFRNILEHLEHCGPRERWFDFARGVAWSCFHFTESLGPRFTISLSFHPANEQDRQQLGWVPGICSQRQMLRRRATIL
jgi:hypothetical protein